jgi:hypothetical protein
VSHYCFYCERKFAPKEEFVICQECWSFCACIKCYKEEGNAQGWNEVSLKHRRDELIRSDRHRAPNKRRFDGLAEHEFTMEHANWDTEKGKSNFGIADSTYWD